MPVSHRKFGDLLEEGIKRVHITRKKPIGFILDEFGYELRPEDSSKGRHALGHWYYKKRIPAETSDITKLAQLIVTNSDVDRDWLKAFLESAGYKEADAFCNQFFIPAGNAKMSVTDTVPAQLEIPNSATQQEITTTPPFRRNYLMSLYLIGAIIAISVAAIWITRQNQVIDPLIISATDISKTQPTQSPTSRPSAILTVMPDTESAPTLAVPTANVAPFDGKCPSTSPVPAFEYTSTQSFADFLNSGGSPANLQSGFKALIQNKTILQDGRLEVADLTGDGTPEIIVNAILDTGSLWQILGCNKDQYQPLTNINDPESRYLRFAVDLNGNKLPEIISYRKTQSGATSLYEFMVEEWNGREITSSLDDTHFNEIGTRLPADIFDWQRAIPNATVTTRDINGDGLYEVIMEGGLITPVPTCETRFERQFTETWAWNGKSFQFSDRVYMMPIYRFQRSADGDLAFALKQYDRALTAYQDVLFDANLFAHDQYLPQLEFCKGIESSSENAPIENEQSLLEAYARWRILLINAIDGSEDATEVVYQTLQEKFPENKTGHSYAVIAKVFWEQYQETRDLTKACDSTNAVSETLSLYPTHTAKNICYIP